MKLKLLLLIFVISRVSVYGKTDSTYNCIQGTDSSILHICINESLNSKGSRLFDLNGDEKYDLIFSLEKDILEEKVISAIGYLAIIDPYKRQLHFDYLVEKQSVLGDSNWFPVQQGLNFIVDSSSNNWLLKLDMNAPNVVLFSYGDLTHEGQTLSVKEGLIDKGDYYIAFRFYNTDVEPKGWKNGWMKLKASKEGITIHEIAYKKSSELAIKIGEK